MGTLLFKLLMLDSIVLFYGDESIYIILKRTAVYMLMISKLSCTLLSPYQFCLFVARDTLASSSSLSKLSLYLSIG